LGGLGGSPKAKTKKNLGGACVASLAHYTWAYLGDWPTWAIGLSCGERPASLLFNHALGLG